MTIKGSCHCGKVTFEINAEIPANTDALHLHVLRQTRQAACLFRARTISAHHARSRQGDLPVARKNWLRTTSSSERWTRAPALAAMLRASIRHLRGARRRRPSLSQHRNHHGTRRAKCQGRGLLRLGLAAQGKSWRLCPQGVTEREMHPVNLPDQRYARGTRGRPESHARIQQHKVITGLMKPNFAPPPKGLP